MAGRHRIYLPGYPHHVTQRGNSRQAIVADDEDRHFLLDSLGRAAARTGCAVHCYVLMNNHLHLLVTPSAEGALGRMMQSLGVRYVHYFNRRYDRVGTLWEAPYRACLVDTDRYLAACYRYIEMNPVRAALVSRPGDWRWSSFRHHAYGRPDPVVRWHPRYRDLGETGEERRARYRQWFRLSENPDAEYIRAATGAGDVFASEKRRRTLAVAAGRAAVRRGPGRPKKVSDSN